LKKSTSYTEILPDGTPLEMIFIEGGTFLMGKNQDHEVTVPNFHLGKYPITNEQFVPFLNEVGNQEEAGREWVDLEGSYQNTRCGIHKNETNQYECIKGLEKYPMIYVNWLGAKAYCEWLSQKTGKKYQLPSESCWEYAARSGRHKSSYQYSGGNHLKEVGWYDKNSHGTMPVCLKLANQLGLYDMSGNVWEWCLDHWHENYEGAPRDGSAWLESKNNSHRVLRGGSWYFNDLYCRVSSRLRDYRIDRYYDVGFRVSRY